MVLLCYLKIGQLEWIECAPVSPVSSENPKRIFLNEVMTSRVLYEKSQFLEISREYIEDEVNLEGYSLLVAETSISKNIKPNLEVRCAFDLSNTNMKINQRWGVIGRVRADMENNDILEFLPGAQFKKIQPTINAYNWLSLEPHKHMVIFLVFSPNLKIFDHSIWNFWNSNTKKLHGVLEKYLIENLVDVLIVSGTAATNGPCKDLSRLFPPDVLPEIKGYNNPNTALWGMSISKCGVAYEAKNLDAWKDGKPTPGQLNDCTGGKVEIVDMDVDEEDFCANEIVTDATASDIGMEHSKSYSIESYCPRSDVLPHNTGALELAVETGQERKQQILQDNSYSDGIWNKNEMKEEWFEFIQKYQPGLLPVDTIKRAASTWFEYLPNLEPGKEHTSRYRCKLCFKFTPEFHYYDNIKTDFANQEGILLENKEKNRQRIVQHADAESHKNVILELKARKKWNLEKEISDLIDDQDFSIAATNHHMRLVYIGNFLQRIL